MTKLSECIGNAQFTADGILISGHIYEPLGCIEDVDTGRWYDLGKCTNCGRLEAGFAEFNINPDGRYGETLVVGGSND